MTTTSAAFSDHIEDYKILTDADKVRKNSADDFGIAAQGYYFSCGKHVNGKWTVVYIKPRVDLVKSVEQRCCEGRIGSMQLGRNGNGTIHLNYNDALMIGSGTIEHDLQGIPAEVLALI